jgi:hypothetical protein
MFRPLNFIFSRGVVSGNLMVIDSDGISHAFGDQSGPLIVVRITDRPLDYQLAASRLLNFSPADKVWRI